LIGQGKSRDAPRGGKGKTRSFTQPPEEKRRREESDQTRGRINGARARRREGRGAFLSERRKKGKKANYHHG